jgi:hypothetical protein
VSAFSSTASHRSIGPLQPFAQRLDRRADQKHPALLVGVARLGPAKLNCEAWQGRRFQIARIESRRRLIPQLLDAQPRHFAAAAPAGRERQEKDREIPGIGQTIRRAGRDQPIQDIPGDGPLALVLARPRRGANGQPQR